MTTQSIDHDLKVAHNTGVVYARLGFASSVNPFWAYVKELSEAYTKGYSDGLAMPALEKGEAFNVSIMDGDECMLVKDDLEIGGSVVILCRHGVLSRTGMAPKIIRSEVSKINGSRSAEELIVGSEEWSTGRVSVDGTGGSYAADCAYRLVG